LSGFVIEGDDVHFYAEVAERGGGLALSGRERRCRNEIGQGDRDIQEKLAEINTVRTHGAKMVNFASEDAGSIWGRFEVFMSRSRAFVLPSSALGRRRSSGLRQDSLSLGHVSVRICPVHPQLVV